MTWILSVLAFLVLLTLLVLAHEFGHFMAALRSKVRVEEFGIGLPPRFMTLFFWKGTRFSFNIIPFGGFVRLQGENSLDDNERHKVGSFAAASVLSRLFILGAGVAMNFLIAIFLFTWGFWLWNWVPTYLHLDALLAAEERGEVNIDWAVAVTKVVEDSPAMLAGIQSGDILVEVNGIDVESPEQIIALQKKESVMTYTLLSGGDALATSEEEYGEEREITVPLVEGRAGMEISPFALTMEGAKRSFSEGVLLSLRETWIVTVGTLQGIGHLISSLAVEQRVPEDIAGIVGIAQMTHHSIQAGFLKYLRLVALLSLSLAVLNILPFPALDGGRMLFVFYELIAGRPANRRFEVMTNGIGIGLIMLLMIAVTWNDILRIVIS